MNNNWTIQKKKDQQDAISLDTHVGTKIHVFAIKKNVFSILAFEKVTKITLQLQCNTNTNTQVYIQKRYFKNVNKLYCWKFITSFNNLIVLNKLLMPFQ